MIVLIPAKVIDKIIKDNFPEDGEATEEIRRVKGNMLDWLHYGEYICIEYNTVDDTMTVIRPSGGI